MKRPSLIFHLACLIAIAVSSGHSLAAVTGARETFMQDQAASVTVGREAPGTAIYALAVGPETALVVASENGLWQQSAATWQKLAPPPFPVRKMAADKKLLWIANGSTVACRRDDRWQQYRLPENSAVTALCPVQEFCLVATTSGLWRLAGGTSVRLTKENISVLSCAVLQNQIIIGCEQGLFSAPLSRNKTLVLSPLYPADQTYSWWPRQVTALTSNAQGLWLGCQGGAARLADGQWTLFAGQEGLPYDHFTCAAIAADGAVWFGTEQGLCRFDGRRWAYRASRRWLPDNRVNAIAATPDGSVWIATRSGLVCFRSQPTTLADKAATFEQIIEQRHTRMGFIVRSTLKQEGDFSTAWINHTDNDGLYTAMYGAAEAFRYGAGKEPQAKARAERTFKALKLLTDVTGIPGFPARSVIPADWSPNPNEKMTPQVNRQLKNSDPLWKEIYPRWPKSKDGRYLWKCDTSSDEICGHYFFYAVYYDLVAETEEERRPVRALVKAITDHIVDHGYKLVDWDGQPTRWANWSPEYVNAPEGWADRGLQSMEILSFLNVARHITGEEKYLQAAHYLCQEHSYHINAISGRAVFPPNLVVPWDNNLAFLSYYGLLKYEKNSDLLKLWQASIERNWLFASRQNDPFFTFVYRIFKPDQASPILEATLPDIKDAMDNAIGTLCATPQILLGWEMKNSHRLDVVLDNTPGQRPHYGWSVSGNALPIDERCHIRINSDHFNLDHEQGGGFCEYEGTLFLLPYYMALYHQLLQN